MGQPNIRGNLVSGPLQNVSVLYYPKDYVGDQVFPLINSQSPEAKIGKFLKGAWSRDDAGIRAPGTRAKRGGYDITSVSIDAKEYARAMEVTQEDRRLAALANSLPMQPEAEAIEFCTHKILLKKEVRIASLVTGSTWDTTNEDCDGNWAAAATTNTFIVDVFGAIESIYSNTGLRPNRLLVSFNTWIQLLQVSGVIDRIKYVMKGIIDQNTIAQIFGLDQIIIAGMVKNSAKETKAGTEFTISRIWETNSGKGGAFLYYAPSSPGLRTPSAGYQTRVAYDSGIYREVRTYYEAAEKQDVYEVSENVDITQIASDLGHYFYDTIAD